MRHLEELASALNDLILIHNDRIEGYLNAIDSLDDNDLDLKLIFKKMISNSKDQKSKLGDLIYEVGGEVEEGTTTTGKIFRSWMDIKSIFSLNDRSSVLDSCEAGEDAALKAYDMALASDAEMSAEVRQMLMDQRSSIKVDHDQIKKLRDFQKSIT